MKKNRSLIVFASSTIILSSMLSFSSVYADPYVSLKPARISETQVFAMGGFDPVSYFKPGLPKAGKKEIKHIYQGRIYLFSSQANKKAFVETPVLYTPQYAGHCAHSFSQSIELLGNPEIFQVDDNGKLFLFADQGAKNKWLQNSAAAKLKADDRWKLRAESLTKLGAKF
jgi:YHS domain-containing protein